MPLYPLIPFHDLFRVDGQLLVGIHHHAEEAGVCLWEKREEFVRICVCVELSTSIRVRYHLWTVK